MNASSSSGSVQKVSGGGAEISTTPSSPSTNQLPPSLPLLLLTDYLSDSPCFAPSGRSRVLWSLVEEPHLDQKAEHASVLVLVAQVTIEGE